MFWPNQRNNSRIVKNKDKKAEVDLTDKARKLRIMISSALARTLLHPSSEARFKDIRVLSTIYQTKMDEFDIHFKLFES
jgi:hypothetical protein